MKKKIKEREGWRGWESSYLPPNLKLVWGLGRLLPPPPKLVTSLGLGFAPSPPSSSPPGSDSFVFVIYQFSSFFLFFLFEFGRGGRGRLDLLVDLRSDLSASLHCV